MKSAAHVSLILLPAVLAACVSPRWENAKFPDANLRSDLAICHLDAERAARVGQLKSVSEQTLCTRQGQDCMPLPENQTAETVAAGQGMVRRCMKDKGWTQG